MRKTTKVTRYPLKAGTVLAAPGAPSQAAVEKVAVEIGPKMVVQSGPARWEVSRVTRYWDDRAGCEMVAAVGESASRQPFSFCKKATATVRVVRP